MKRYTIVSATTAAMLTLGGLAYAQTAPTPQPPGGPDAGPGVMAPGPNGPPGPPGQMPGKHGMGHMGRPPWFGGQGPGPGMGQGPDGMPFGPPPAFGLFAQLPDKHLTAGDVTVIAQSILLENGNHSWKVDDVTPQGDKSIQFSYVTQHGDVVATFAVDPATGFIKRVG